MPPSNAKFQVGSLTGLLSAGCLLLIQSNGAIAQAVVETKPGLRDVRQVDERRAARVGLRKVVSRHLRLYTDLPASDAVDELPAVFDAAVDEWTEYFGVEPEQTARWKTQGFLINDRAKFAALGLLPKARPDFGNGFANGHELWLMDQPSDYYRRHLLLHEGTHAFMYAHVGQMAPGWYMEGMAELLGTHRWQHGKLELRTMPSVRQEVPMWGRIKLIRDAHRADESLELAAVLSLDGRRTFSTAEYAWTWALCNFLDSHPRWQKKFRQLAMTVDEPHFNDRFRQTFRDDWSDVQFEWRAFVATLDYGYDARRMATEHRAAGPVTTTDEATIAADRGWQSTGWLLEAGKKYRLTATGRYQIADDGGPWPAEPGGVTLAYHDGHPLGMLLGALRSTTSHKISAPIALGISGTLLPTGDAILYLRVNDSPARLSDNQGTLRARIARSAD